MKWLPVLNVVWSLLPMGCLATQPTLPSVPDIEPLPTPDATLALQAFDDVAAHTSGAVGFWVPRRVEECMSRDPVPPHPPCIDAEAAQRVLDSVRGALFRCADGECVADGVSRAAMWCAAYPDDCRTYPPTALIYGYTQVHVLFSGPEEAPVIIAIIGMETATREQVALWRCSDR